MNVKVKIDENQDFKNMIIKRIQQELHQILKTDFNNIVKSKIESDLEKHIKNFHFDEKVRLWVKDYVQSRAKSVVGDSYYGHSKIDKYIQDYIDKRLADRFDKAFDKRFTTRSDPNEQP